MLPTLNLTTTEQRLLTNSVSKSRKIKSLLIPVRRPNCYVIRQATFAFVTYSQQDRERVENENQNEYEKFLACIKQSLECRILIQSAEITSKMRGTVL